VVPSYLRCAAGACMLAAGLMIGAWAATAVANADSSNSDSSNSAEHGAGGANSSGEDSNRASGPVGHDTQRKEIQGVTSTSTLGFGRQTDQQPSPGSKRPKQEPGGTDTRDERKDSGPVTDEQVTDTRDRGQHPCSGAKRPKQEPGGTGTKDETKVSDPVAANSNVVSPVSNLTSVSDVSPAPDPTPRARLPRCTRSAGAGRGTTSR